MSGGSNPNVRAMARARESRPEGVCTACHDYMVGQHRGGRTVLATNYHRECHDALQRFVEAQGGRAAEPAKAEWVMRGEGGGGE